MELRALLEFCEKGIITAERMRVVDRNAIALGLPAARMMESAGIALARAVLAERPGKVLVLCGRGNNGGDGMAAARHLQPAVDTEVWYHEDPAMTAETRHQLHLLPLSAVPVHPVRCPADAALLPGSLSSADLVIDALLGTGAGGYLREPYATMVRDVNVSGVPVLSADVPTLGIRPSRVLAFHRPKGAGAEVAGIGIPLAAEVLVGPGDLSLIPERQPDAHKGASGNVLVIGGGPYQGAPYLSALAALRAGADLVRIASPVPSPYPDLIHEPLPGQRITDEHTDALSRLAARADVIVCGMGAGPGAHGVFCDVVPSCNKAVIDADALFDPLPRTREVVYTPHGGEFRRVTGHAVPMDPAERARTAREAGFPGTILLKGRVDVITDGVRVRFNTTGTPAMTVGGTGDILAGVTGALLCTLPPFEAACIAAYTTGAAGEAAAGGMQAGILASDLLPRIPQVLYGGK